MKPLNEKEYNKAFWQFTIMWIIATLLIVVVCLQVMKVPGKVNSETGEELSDLYKIKEDQKSIMIVIDSINLVLEEFQNRENSRVLNKLKKINYKSIKDVEIRENLADFGEGTRATYLKIEEEKGECMDDLQLEKKINRDRESEIRKLQQELTNYNK